MTDKANESPRTEVGTRTFSREDVVVTDDGAEIAVVTMSITTLRSFQKEHIEELLEKYAQTGHVLKKMG